MVSQHIDIYATHRSGLTYKQLVPGSTQRYNCKMYLKHLTKYMLGRKACAFDLKIKIQRQDIEWLST